MNSLLSMSDLTMNSNAKLSMQLTKYIKFPVKDHCRPLSALSGLAEMFGYYAFLSVSETAHPLLFDFVFLPVI